MWRQEAPRGGYDSGYACFLGRVQLGPWFGAHFPIYSRVLERDPKSIAMMDFSKLEAPAGM